LKKKFNTEEKTNTERGNAAKQKKYSFMFPKGRIVGKKRRDREAYSGGTASA